MPSVTEVSQYFALRCRISWGRLPANNLSSSRTNRAIAHRKGTSEHKCQTYLKLFKLRQALCDHSSQYCTIPLMLYNDGPDEVEACDQGICISRSWFSVPETLPPQLQMSSRYDIVSSNYRHSNVLRQQVLWNVSPLRSAKCSV
jgi:hypothetical protein